MVILCSDAPTPVPRGPLSLSLLKKHDRHSARSRKDRSQRDNATGIMTKVHDAGLALAAV